MKNYKPCRITIGLPVFNDESIVGEAIESVLMQSFTSFKLVIADNCSTDNTQGVCEKYLRSDSRIEYIRHSRNCGQVENFNFLKQVADSEFFIWIASDDRWSNTFLSKAIELMDKYSDCSIVFSNFIVRNLETLEEKQETVKDAKSYQPWKRVLKRIVNMRPSLVYGLQRQKLLQQYKLCLFDFSDVFFTLCAALEGKILIIPENCYIAGVKGKRVAYSLTGDKINRKTYLIKAFQLFKENLPSHQAVLLSVVTLFSMVRQKFSTLIKVS